MVEQSQGEVDNENKNYGLLLCNGLPIAKNEKLSFLWALNIGQENSKLWMLGMLCDNGFGLLCQSILWYIHLKEPRRIGLPSKVTVAMIKTVSWRIVDDIEDLHKKFGSVEPAM